MKTSLLLVCLSLWLTLPSLGQSTHDASPLKVVDFAATVGSANGTVALSYVHNWRLGKKKRIEAGIGARLTTAFGKKLDYTTAGPASLTRSFTTPFLIFFAGQQTENWDTLSVQRPLVNALNLTVNLGYNFNSRLSAGFNIDLIGASFGRSSSAILQSNGNLRTEPSAKPTVFNVLLTGDHDRGSLNSEFFLKYKINSNWGVRAIYQFLFTEYQTQDIVQIAGDGTEIDRFRNKANNFGLGLTYQF
ncbi:putative outer membrane protein [Dyadobacter jejuensis]|uniref:Putative outer membrane protein n=1 Tax=Dyadobacter jejuensis TaxID=1082580 RepID=A0A316AMV3_9BACT|nr:hypothetical protein [Dyadobacter jejuensis]PWJ58788.1 putative outer membrane protein [Dyadobacter jejuensis]